MIFDLSETIRLTPMVERKPKSAEIMPLLAGSDLSASLKSVLVHYTPLKRNCQPKFIYRLTIRLNSLPCAKGGGQSG